MLYRDDDNNNTNAYGTILLLYAGRPSSTSTTTTVYTHVAHTHSVGGSGLLWLLKPVYSGPWPGYRMVVVVSAHGVYALTAPDTIFEKNKKPCPLLHQHVVRYRNRDSKIDDDLIFGRFCVRTKRSSGRREIYLVHSPVDVISWRARFAPLTS